MLERPPVQPGRVRGLGLWVPPLRPAPGLRRIEDRTAPARGPGDPALVAEGIYANTINPGAVATGLQKYAGGLKTAAERRKSVEQGAATSVFLAASSLAEVIGGRYFEDFNEAGIRTESPGLFGTGVADHALEPRPAGHRAEDLLRRDHRVVVHVAGHGGLDEPAAVQVLRASAADGQPFRVGQDVGVGGASCARVIPSLIVT